MSVCVRTTSPIAQLLSGAPEAILSLRLVLSSAFGIPNSLLRSSHVRVTGKLGSLIAMIKCYAFISTRVWNFVECR